MIIELVKLWGSPRSHHTTRLEQFAGSRLGKVADWVLGGSIVIGLLWVMWYTCPQVHW
jgi:hypothetical protein